MNPEGLAVPAALAHVLFLLQTWCYVINEERTGTYPWYLQHIYSVAVNKVMGATSKLFACNSNYPVQHVLIDCEDVADVRPTFYNDPNLYDVFTNVAGETILKFLIDINIYTQRYSSKYTVSSL